MKNFIIANLMMFILAFLVIFIFYNIRYRSKKIRTRKKEITEAKYIINKFDLDMKKIKYKDLLFTISIVNSTIIGFTFMVVMHIESYALGLIIGFVLLILLTYSIYEIIGRYYQKKGRK